MTHFDLVRSHRPGPLDAPTRRSLSPGLGERLMAFGIDVAGFVLAAPFVLGFCAVVLRDLWVFGAITVVVCYVAGSWALCSKTAGMYFAGIQLVDERTGRNPSLPQVGMRTMLTVPPMVGATVVLNELVAPGPAPIADVWLALAAAAALMGVSSAAWGAVDSGRMLHDRLSGLVTVRSDSLARVRKAAHR